MDDPRTFGQIVRAARLERRKSDSDFSLRKFAFKVGISPTFLSKAETDEFQPPRAEKVVRIAEELGIDKYLLLSKANHVDPELKKILLEHQGMLFKLIQGAAELSSDQVMQLLEAMRKVKEDSYA